LHRSCSRLVEAYRHASSIAAALNFCTRCYEGARVVPRCCYRGEPTGFRILTKPPPFLDVDNPIYLAGSDT
jgi:hypothetical protein